MSAYEGGLLAAFLLGLTGGAHCIGMCGPLVTAYTEGHDGVRPHALFNAGRTVGYAVVGTALGGVGALAFDAAAVVAVGTDVRAVAGLVAGVLILFVGVRYLLGRPPASLGVGGRLGSVVGRVQSLADGRGIAAVGAAHALLPCPVLYPAFLYALVTGDPVQGGLALAAVGAGTFPTLLAYGTVLESVSAGRRERLHRALGAAFLVLAWVPLSMSVRLL